MHNQRSDNENHPQRQEMCFYEKQMVETLCGFSLWKLHSFQNETLLCRGLAMAACWGHSRQAQTSPTYSNTEGDGLVVTWLLTQKNTAFAFNRIGR